MTVLACPPYLRPDSPDEIDDAVEQIARLFAPAILAAIENRIESGTLAVLEGDWISPERGAGASGLGVRPENKVCRWTCGA